MSYKFCLLPEYYRPPSSLQRFRSGENGETGVLRHSRLLSRILWTGLEERKWRNAVLDVALVTVCLWDFLRGLTWLNTCSLCWKYCLERLWNLWVVGA